MSIRKSRRSPRRQPTIQCAHAGTARSQRQDSAHPFRREPRHPPAPWRTRQKCSAYRQGQTIRISTRGSAGASDGRPFLGALGGHAMRFLSARLAHNPSLHAASDHHQLRPMTLQVPQAWMTIKGFHVRLCEFHPPHLPHPAVRPLPATRAVADAAGRG